MNVNLNKPYGTVRGMPGVKYAQDGKYFKPDGSLYEPDSHQDNDLLVQCQALKVQGKTDTEIGELLGVTRQKVTRVLNDLP
jgi:hypothetical protein